jgi:PAS domain S-box-containing protein
LKLRTRLFILATLPFLTGLIAVAASLWLLYAVSDFLQEKRLVNELVRNTFNLLTISRDFLDHPEDVEPRRQMEQALTDMDALMERMRVAGERSDVLHRAIVAETATLKDLTNNLAGLSGEMVTDWYSLVELVRQQRQRILVNAGSLIDYALKLSASDTDYIVASHRRFNEIFIAAVAAVSLLFAVSGWWFGRRLQVVLRKLQQGADIIGSGVLEHRLEVTGTDELASVAATFNRMAERLRETLASREQLNREIRERRQAEFALEQSERRFRGYFEQGYIGMAITSPETEWISVNQRLCEMLGYTAEELRLKTWIELTHPGDRETDVAFFRRLMAGEIDNYEMDKRFVRKDGGLIHTHLTVAAVRDADGRVRSVLAALLDISDRVRADEELVRYREHLEELVRLRTRDLEASEQRFRLLNAELEQRVDERTRQLSQALSELRAAQQTLLQNERLATIGTMSAGIAHELNNPLMGVVNYVQFAKNRAVDARTREILGKAERELMRMGKVVQGLLDFSRPARGRVGAVNVADIVGHTLDLLGADLAKHGIRVVCELPPELPAVHAEPDGLQQVLINLLINARDALEGCRDPRITVEVGVQPEGVCLAVRDSGPGIPPERRERIFEPFFTTKPAGKGTGLGLSVSVSILRSFGGTLLYRAPEGAGAEFRILLPVEGEGKGSA